MFTISETMLKGLTKVSWERVDVSFSGSKQRFLAHSTIQASIWLIFKSHSSSFNHQDRLLFSVRINLESLRFNLEYICRVCLATNIFCSSIWCVWTSKLLQCLWRYHLCSNAHIWPEHCIWNSSL